MTQIENALTLVAKSFATGVVGGIVRARSLLKMTLHSMMEAEIPNAEDRLTSILALLKKHCVNSDEHEVLVALCEGVKGADRDRLAREVVYGVAKFLDDVEDIVLRCDELLAQNHSEQGGGWKILKRALSIARNNYCAILPVGLERLGRGESLLVSDLIPDGRDCVAEPIATYAIYALLVKGE